MPTIEQFITLSQFIRSGASFSRVVVMLKSANIKGYSYHVASGDIGFYDAHDEKMLISGPISLHQHVTKEQNGKPFAYILRRHQAGLMDFAVFCQKAASCGVNLWVVDLTRMTVSYFAINGSLIQESAL